MPKWQKHTTRSADSLEWQRERRRLTALWQSGGMMPLSTTTTKNSQALQELPEFKWLANKAADLRGPHRPVHDLLAISAGQNHFDIGPDVGSCLNYFATRGPWERHVQENNIDSR